MEINIDNMMRNSFGVLTNRCSIDDILENAKISITSLEGGDKHNAIPREAFAQLYIHPESVSDAQNSVANIASALRNEFGTMEPNFDVKFTGSSELPDKCLSDSSQMELIGLLRTLPHGVLKYSHDVQGLVAVSYTHLRAHET